MFKIKILILTLLILPIIAHSQNVIIKGKVTHYRTLQPMCYTQILFDSTNQIIANGQGEFEFIVPKNKIKDTLKIRYIGCFDINIINISYNNDSINLGVIPIFDYSPDYDMIHLNCADNDYECKEKEKKHIEKENKRVEVYYTNIHNLIEYFDYRFQNKTFKIDIETGCIDLSTEK